MYNDDVQHDGQQRKEENILENKPIPREKMKQLRGKRSTLEVAQALGISESAYVKYERGERNPKDDMKRKIASYYKKSVAFLFYS